MKNFIVSLVLFASPAIALAAGSTLDATFAVSAPASLPQGAQRVHMGSISLEASCEDAVTVSAITLKHTGLGDADDISGVYVMEKNRRMSRVRTFTRSDATVELKLSALSVPACSTRTIDVLADLSPNAAANGEHGLSLLSIASDADSTNIKSQRQTVPSRTTPAVSGAVSVDHLPVRTKVAYGKDRTIARIKLEAEGNDQAIHSMTFTNDGKARDKDLKNIRLLKPDGTSVCSEASRLDDDTVHFACDVPLLVRKGESRILEVHADIMSGQRQTIDLRIEEPSDISATIAKQRGQRFQ